MSWNLLIHSDGNALGEISDVTAKFNVVFPGLHWEAPTEAVLPEEGFRMDLNLEEEFVQDIYTHGGFPLVPQLAALCRQEGWQIADAQEGENIDLDNPLQWIEERMG